MSNHQKLGTRCLCCDLSSPHVESHVSTMTSLTLDGTWDNALKVASGLPINLISTFILRRCKTKQDLNHQFTEKTVSASAGHSVNLADW